MDFTVQSWNEAYNSAKNILKIHGQIKGQVAPSPPPKYAIGWCAAILSLNLPWRYSFCHIICRLVLAADWKQMKPTCDIILFSAKMNLIPSVIKVMASLVTLSHLRCRLISRQFMILFSLSWSWRFCLSLGT